MIQSKKFLGILFLVFLYGCTPITTPSEQDISMEEYQGEFLKVGVVGTDSLPNLKRIEYEYVKLNDLNGKEEFDILIITSEAFIEADKIRYMTFYDNVEYPVFFFGMKDLKIFAFIDKNLSIEDSKYNDQAYVQGFKNVDGNKVVFGFYHSELSDSLADMLIRVFNSL